MAFRFAPLDSSRLEDVADLFSTSRECMLCWCMNHRVPPAEEVQGDQARAAMENLVKEGKAFSVLAYEGNQCVGWCAVDPLTAQPGHDYMHWKHAEKDEGTWSIHCLYIHPEFRGKDLSGPLIEEAVNLAKANGAKKIIAFPIPKEMRDKFPEHDGEFSGRFTSYTKRGFVSTARINDFYEVVTRTD